MHIFNSSLYAELAWTVYPQDSTGNTNAGVSLIMNEYKLGYKLEIRTRSFAIFNAPDVILEQSSFKLKFYNTVNAPWSSYMWMQLAI